MPDNTVDAQASDKKVHAFMKWLQQRPHSHINPKIEVVDLQANNARRGVVAKADIADDEELFAIQLDDVLSVQNSRLSSLCPDVFNSLDSWNALILTMIYEDGLVEQSQWWPYLDLLPAEFDTLIYWSPAELEELKGSAVIEKIGKEEAEISFVKLLLPAVQNHASLFGKYSSTFAGPRAQESLIKLSHRMATLIMAYGFDLENEPSSGEEDEADGSSQSVYELNKGMVPLADMFNADADLNNAHLLQNETSMAMVALKPIKNGEEIFNDYGSLPRSDLLRRYGYVTDRYKKWDVVEISIASISSSCATIYQLSEDEKNERLQLAAQWEVLQDGYDLNRPAANKSFKFDDDLTLTMTALLLDQTRSQEAMTQAEAPTKPPEYLQLELCHALKALITQRNHEFRTTIAEDTALLKDRNLPIRRRMAIEVRLGEKEILATAAEEVDKRITKLTCKDDEQQSKDVKKRKT